ncbi:MAG: AAA family ATPase [Comamonadaceae bacterium]|nr:AAA family ATPase [Comamonadaceae bacterium]
MEIAVPKLSLVVLIGPSGSGKSTFARRHFLPTEVLSSDECRGLVSDDENDLAVTNEAFEVLHFIAAKRLAGGRLTVVDATNVQPEARKPLVALAREFHCLPVAIVFDLPEKLCQERNRGRSDRDIGPHVIRGQASQMRRGLRGLQREGFRHVFVLKSPEDVDAAVVDACSRCGTTSETSTARSTSSATCMAAAMNWRLCCGSWATNRASFPKMTRPGAGIYRHPDGRKAVFLGDLVDRGPRVLDTLKLVRNMVKAGTAFCVPGNHDMKLMRKLAGKDVQITHGLAESLAEFEARAGGCPQSRLLPRPASSWTAWSVITCWTTASWLSPTPACRQEMQGRGSGKVREFALYGETTGETDEFGLPVRYNWAAEYRGSAAVVYGHTPVPEPEWLNRTVNIDTGCVFGGSLTALTVPGEGVRLPPGGTDLLRTDASPSCRRISRRRACPPSSGTTTCWMRKMSSASGSLPRACVARSPSARKTLRPPWRS